MEMKNAQQRTNPVVSVWSDNMNASVWGTSTTLRFIKIALNCTIIIFINDLQRWHAAE